MLSECQEFITVNRIQETTLHAVQALEEGGRGVYNAPVLVFSIPPDMSLVLDNHVADVILPSSSQKRFDFGTTLAKDADNSGFHAKSVIDDAAQQFKVAVISRCRIYDAHVFFGEVERYSIRITSSMHSALRISEISVYLGIRNGKIKIMTVIQIIGGFDSHDDHAKL